MKAKLNKISVVTPIINIALREDLQLYMEAKTDEELMTFYHKMLDKHEGNPLAESVIYAMISQSVGYSLRSLKTEI